MYAPRQLSEVAHRDGHQTKRYPLLSGNRQIRPRKGKSDSGDAVAAARAALSGTATGSPTSRDGNVEAIRVLMIARRSTVATRIETLNKLRHVVLLEVRRSTENIVTHTTRLHTIAGSKAWNHAFAYLKVI